MSIEVINSIANTESFLRLFLNYHKRMPNGEKCHYCPEWDFLPIDADCKEFEVCTCKFSIEPEHD